MYSVLLILIIRMIRILSRNNYKKFEKVIVDSVCPAEYNTDVRIYIYQNFLLGNHVIQIMWFFIML